MWIRRDLKERAKTAFKANYWKCVLVALIMAAIMGSGSFGSQTGNNRRDSSISPAEQQQMTEALEELGGEELGEAFDVLSQQMQRYSWQKNAAMAITLGSLGMIGIALSVLVLNPLLVGCRKFFLQNSRGGAELSEMGYAFKNGNWGRTVLTMFLQGLFLVLWTLLFIVPGIVKAYAYRLTPYLLSEHPELTGTQAITLSRQMMKGHKWRAFVLDLSFIGWILLSVLTLGILTIFYVGPYMNATDAELYEAVKAEYEAKNAAPVQA